MGKCRSVDPDRAVSSSLASRSFEGGNYPIVMACDEAYAMPLAVAVRSVAEANRSGKLLEIVILTDKFSADMKRRVETSVPDGAAAFYWVQVDLSQFEGCSGMLHHLSKMTYARLLLPYVLPHNVPRALYLDSDISSSGRSRTVVGYES